MSMPTEEVPFEAVIDESQLQAGLGLIEEAFGNLEKVVADVGGAASGDFEDMTAAMDLINTEGVQPLMIALGLLGDMFPNLLDRFSSLQEMLQQAATDGSTTGEALQSLANLMQQLGDPAMNAFGVSVRTASEWLQTLADKLPVTDAGLLNLYQRLLLGDSATNQFAGAVLQNADNLDKLTAAAEQDRAVQEALAQQYGITAGALNDAYDAIEKMILAENDEQFQAERDAATQQALVDTIFTNAETRDLMDAAVQRIIDAETREAEAAQQDAADQYRLVQGIFDNIETRQLMEGAVDNVIAKYGEEASWIEKIQQFMADMGLTFLDTTRTMEDGASQAGAAMQDLADKTAAADDEIKAANDSVRGFGLGVGGFVKAMVGFALLNDATRGLQDFANMAFQGNAQVEKLTMQLTNLLGSSGAAQALVDWTFKFGQTAPFTTSSIQTAAVTIASFGGNVYEVLPALAKVAAAVGTDLPTAANALLAAYSQDRFIMLQRQLRVTKTELEDFGLVVNKNGSVVQSTLLPAIERFAQAKFPNSLTDAMQTFYGVSTNLTDQMQMLALAFGKPVFEVFKQALIDVVHWLQQNHDMLIQVATDVGTYLADAFTALRDILQPVLTFLIQHHLALAALASIIGGILVAGLGILVSLFGGLLSTISPVVVVLTLLSTALSAATAWVVSLYNSNAQFRDEVNRLWAALQVLGGYLAGLFTQALQDVVTWLQPVVTWFSNLFDHMGPVQQVVQTVTTKTGDLSGGLQILHGRVNDVTDVVTNIHGPLGTVATDFGNIVTAIQNLVTWLVGTPDHVVTVHDKVRDLKDVLAAQADGINTTTAPALDTLNTKLVTIKGTTGAIATALDTIKTSLELVGKAAQGTATFLGDLAAPFVAIGQGIAAVFAGGIGPLAQTMGDMGGTIGQTFNATFKSIAQTWNTQVIPAWNNLKTQLAPMVPIFQAIGAAIGVILLVFLGSVLGFVSGILQAFATLLDGIARIISGIVQSFSGLITFLGGLLGFFRDFGQIIMDAVGNKPTETIRKDWEKIGGDLGQMWQGIVSMFQGIWSVFTGVLEATLGSIVALVGGWYLTMIDFFSRLFTGVAGPGGSVAQLVEGVAGWFGQLPSMIWNAIVTFFTVTLPNDFKTWGEDAVNAFVNAIESKIPNIGTVAQSVGNAIRSFLHFSVPDQGPLADADQWMAHFGDLLEQGLLNQQNRVRAAALGVAAAVAGQSSPGGSTAFVPTTVALPAPLPGPTGFGGGGGPVVVQVNLNGGIGDGLAMRPSDVYALSQLLGREIGKQVQQQGLVPNGYSTAV